MNVGGHWFILWGTYDENQPQHAYDVTEAVFCFRRASKVERRNVEYEADAKIVGEHTYYLEVDRDTMKTSEIERRMRKYAGCPHDVLWVCPTRERVEELMHVAHEGAEFWFTTMGELKSNPEGQIWEDCNGVRTSVVL